MKLKINRADLARISGAVSSVASNRSINPILKNIGLVAKKKSVQLLATDMAKFVQFDIPANVTETGEVVVDAGIFSTYVGFLESDEVEITGDAKLKVVGNQTAFFQTASYDDFPAIPKPSGNWIKFERKALDDIIRRVGFSVGDQTSKSFLQNIYFGNGLIVATDSHKTAVLEMDLGLKEECLLSPSGLGVVKNLSGDIQANFSKEWTFFKGDNGIVGILAAGGNFPNIKGFLEKWKTEKSQAVLTLNKASLLKVLQITDYFLSQNKDVTNIGLIWEKDVIRVKLSIPELTEFDNTVVGKVKGKAGSVRFRPSMLLRGVEVVDDDNVKITIYDSYKPILIQDDKRKDWTYLVMPVADAEAVAEWEKHKTVELVEDEDDEDFE